MLITSELVETEVGSPGSEKGAREHPDLQYRSRGRLRPVLGQPQAFDPTTMGSAQEKRDQTPTGEHVCVRDERWEGSSPIPRRFPCLPHSRCTHDVCMCAAPCVPGYTTTLPTTHTDTHTTYSPSSPSREGDLAPRRSAVQICLIAPVSARSWSYSEDCCHFWIGATCFTFAT